MRLIFGHLLFNDSITTVKAMESFFGLFKDEVDYQEANNLCELKEMRDEYMEHYNSTRKQWNLKKMTPAQYRSHLIAA